MYFNKVGIRCGMYQFHKLVVHFFMIGVTDPAPLGWGHSLQHLGSLTTQILAQLTSLVLRPLGSAKLQKMCFVLCNCVASSSIYNIVSGV